MLSRLYVDNFRCLVNFEVKFGPTNLLLGVNGAGKSSVFEILNRLQLFILEGAKVEEAFPVADLTRWQELGQQRFELDITLGNDVYTYKLVVDHDRERKRMRALLEELTCNGQPLFTCKEGSAQLYKDNGTEGPQYAFDWSRSGVGGLYERNDNKKLSRFKQVLAKVVIVRPMPVLMVRESKTHDERLRPYAENFVSWYRHMSQEHMGAIVGLFADLKEVLPGFDSISLKEVGEDTRAMKVLFKQTGIKKTQAYDVSELSEGQRMLLVLYTLIHSFQGDDASLFIDEPDNFLALREVQPWLSTLSDAIGDKLGQAVIISHHPEIVNYLGGAHGIWLERDGGGPVRVAPSPKNVDGLSLGDTVARGWEQ